MLKRLRQIEKSQYPIIGILLIAIITRMAFLATYGPMYSLNSDDVAYVEAGIRFAHTGAVTMHDVISAQIMPGMLYLLAPFVWLLGESELLWWGLKIFWNILGVLSIYGTYRCVKELSNGYCGAIGAALFLTIDFTWMDNLILTETPFMFCMIWIIYFTLRIARQPKYRYFWGIVATYMGALLMRPNVAPYPLFLFLYLLVKHYDIQLLWRQILIAACVVLAFIVPWTIRNYIQFDRFIPLTYGMGNPLLLGTYQGVGYPLDEELDYSHLIEKMPEESLAYYDQETQTWDLSSYMGKFYSLEYDELMAKYRMSVWWEDDPASMLHSYLLSKPKIMLLGSFCWDTPFGISAEANMPIRYLDLGLALIGSAILLFDRKRRPETLMIGTFYAFQIAVYSYSFALNRYGQTLYFMRFILVGWGIYRVYELLKERKNRLAN